MRRWASGALAALALGGAALAAEPLVVCDGGRILPVVVADDAPIAERTAAGELALWLSRACGGRVPILAASEAPNLRVEGRGFGEHWAIEVDGAGIVLRGGRPRGALYAVYAFLEREVGVRWWNPWESTLPDIDRLALAPGARRGEPAFAYREITDVGGPLPFRARMRLNGHFSRLGPRWGGALRFGPPHQAHTFFTYVPPARWFESHPHYFSEYGDLRYANETQLCLTEPTLPALLEAELVANIERGIAEAREAGREPPRYYSISQNDWGKPCGCERCAALVEAEGSQAAPILAMVNRLARAVGERYPDVSIDTLAYQYSLQPPRTLTAEPNVVVRVSGLHQRDFARAITDPSNARVREAIEGWTRVADHVRVWDYATLWGTFDDLPFPSLSYVGEDLRFYREIGVEGLYIQHPYAIGADMRDLKLWVTAKLLENPMRDPDALIDGFTRGFYGDAAPWIRRYLDRLARAADERVEFDAEFADPDYLRDVRFLRDAHRLFARAAGAVAGDRTLERRVRHARLTLDRATLHNWKAIGSLGLDRAEIAARYRQAWFEQIELRVPALERAEWRSWIDWELAGLEP